MLRLLKKENMGNSNLGWLESRFHFSFAEYRNPQNINFGVLRVLNDDIIHAKSGFGTHPHHDMEIISYIVKGQITHKDSMGNEESLGRGEVQYLSAGTGIQHSEYNNTDEDLRLLQIWIIPPQKGMNTLYGSHRFTHQERKNTLLNIVSNELGDAPIKIHQDVTIYVSELDANREIEYEIKENRQVYFVLIEGNITVDNNTLEYGDSIEITHERLLKISSVKESHFLFIDMQKS